MIRLSGDERFDERIGGLSIERQSVAQRLQLGRLLKEGLLETAAASVEVLFDGVKGHIQDGTLLWCQVLFKLFGYFLHKDEIS